VKYTCGAVHICSYLSLILLEEHAGLRFLFEKKRPSDRSYYGLAWLQANSFQVKTWTSSKDLA